MCMGNRFQILTASVKKARVRLPYTTSVPRLVPYNDPIGTQHDALSLHRLHFSIEISNKDLYPTDDRHQDRSMGHVTVNRTASRT
jgi:hypothetical protein